MSNGIWSAASGATAQLHMLDVAANNLANASTPAFRGDRAVFNERMVDAERAGNAREYRRYTTMNTASPDMSQGSLKETGRPLDIALEGEGFLVVQTDEGQRYTRAGSLHRSVDGALLSTDGAPLLGEDGQPLQAPPEEQLTIAPDGSVLAGEYPIGKLKIVNFDRPETLVRVGQTLYARGPGAVETVAAETTVVAGALEMSNVSVVKGMADLVTATRSFEALQKVIDTFSETERRAAMGIMGRR